MGLLKSLKNSVLEDLWTFNMLKGRKDCLNIQGSVIVIFFEHAARKSARKILCY